ncbi:MAG: magnesium transporter CorA family protein [Tissierellales bacterium]|nr:magnesium transporter CorA family protein [Tissierellales bacterium]MBN2828287.1 magnesium transporter CorA family protein [Tissierellales bacterium]
MISIFKTIDDNLFTLKEIEDGAWISLIDPTTEELQEIEEELGVDMDFLRAALDEEEYSRIETYEDQLLILVDMPIVETEEEHLVYSTIPFGIVLAGKNIITVCLKDSVVIDQFEKNSVRSFATYKRYRFVLQILFKIAKRYLLYLKQIDRMSTHIERQLHQSMKNRELIQLLDLEKSLVYFTTSLRANEIVLEKMMKLEAMKLYEEDKDLLDDVIIENKQAIEMASIYSGILSGMMDAFASIISNNLNIVMRILTSITIIMAIPTMIASFYGMNVKWLPMAANPGAFWIILGISGFLSMVAGIVLTKKNMF